MNYPLRSNYPQEGFQAARDGNESVLGLCPPHSVGADRSHRRFGRSRWWLSCARRWACGIVVAMAWETSNRRSRLPRDWEARRRIVIARDNGRCQATIGGVRCTSEGTEVDHIIAGDNHDLTNLRLLCEACHAWKTRGEATAGRRARQQKEKTKPLNESWR